MTLEELTKNTSPYLLCWIDLSLSPKRLTVPYDLKKVKRLEDKNFPVPYSAYTRKSLEHLQDYLASKKGDWALLGELTNLQVLEFPKRTPSGLVDDFSFLPRLKNLRRLCLEHTGFTDCSLLSGLTQLKHLTLPARKKLIHTEVLETLSCQIHMDEPIYTDSSFPKYEILPVKEIPASDSDTFAIQYIEYNRNSYTGGEITQAVVDELARLIRAGQVNSLCLSMDENGEDDFFTMDIEEGWAAPAFNTWDEGGNTLFYQPVNKKYDSEEEDAPVQIGGQSPVPKRLALDDLELAVECVLHLIARIACPMIPISHISEFVIR